MTGMSRDLHDNFMVFQERYVISWQNSPVLTASSKCHAAWSFSECGRPNSIPIMRPLP